MLRGYSTRYSVRYSSRSNERGEKVLVYSPLHYTHLDMTPSRAADGFLREGREEV